MNRQKLSQQVMGAMLITLLLVGCGAPAATPVPPTATPVPPTATPTPEPPTATPTPVPPTATPTPKPATATPTQAFTLATSAEEIVGTWVAGNYYIRFDRDGTFRQAHALDKLDSQPYAISSYQFEGTKMVITEVSVSGVPTCGKKIGSYEIQLLESGNIRIVAIKDQCAPRAGDIAGEYEPVIDPNPDQLVFVLIENKEAAYTVYFGIPKDIRDEDLEEIQAIESVEEEVRLISWEDFEQNIDEFVTAKIVKNDYEDSQVVKGIVELVQMYPMTPFGLTWNGGIALMFSDYEHAKRIYQQYQADPDEYEETRNRDPKGDPINPQNHLGPLLGW